MTRSVAVDAELPFDLRYKLPDEVTFVLVVRSRNAVGVPAVAAFGCDNDEIVWGRVFGQRGFVRPIVEVPEQPVQQIDHGVTFRSFLLVVCGENHAVIYLAAE